MDPKLQKFEVAKTSFFHWSVVSNNKNSLAWLNWALINQCIDGEYNKAETAVEFSRLAQLVWAICQCDMSTIVAVKTRLSLPARSEIMKPQWLTRLPWAPSDLSFGCGSGTRKRFRGIMADMPT